MTTRTQLPETVLSLETYLVDPTTIYDPGDNVRLEDSRAVQNTEALQASIRETGILTPLVVRPKTERGWPLIHGRRRRAAAIAIGLKEVPIIVDRHDLQDTTEHYAQALAEGVVRKELHPSTIARNMLLLLDPSHGYNPARIQRLLGMNQDDFRAHIALIDAPVALVQRIDRGEIAWSTWKNRLRTAPRQVQEQIATEEKPTMRRVRQLIAEAQPDQLTIEAEGFYRNDLWQRAESLLAETRTLLRDMSLFSENDPYRPRTIVTLQRIQRLLNQFEGEQDAPVEENFHDDAE